MPFTIPMRPRSPVEPHRASTPLELLFDLVFVVAIAQAAAGLHHAMVAGHLGHGLLGFGVILFAIWWAWMNFTWFASAYDTDDTLYRLMVLLQLTGALIFVAGLPRIFDAMDFRVAVAGYVVMRFAMVSQWLRASTADPTHTDNARRYALGIALVQFGWVGLLWLPATAVLAAFVLLMLAELAVPVWAERGAATTWHPGHITERYGLFTIIVLGESILAAMVAIQAALSAGTAFSRLAVLVVGGLLIVYSVWWLYFDGSDPARLSSLTRAFRWGYGHVVIFAAIAALGAGLGVAVDHATGATSLSLTASGYAIAIPVATYLVALWLLHDCMTTRPVPRPALLPITALLVLLAPLGPAPALVIGLLMAGAVALRGSFRRPHDDR
jgi:low temperature requirement protein LtrA